MRGSTRSGSGRIVDLLLGLTKYFYIYLLSALALLPLLWALLSSMKTNTEILNSGLSLPSRFSLAGYFSAFRIAPIHVYYFNSVIISVVSTALNVLLVGMAAYVTARFTFRWAKTVVLLVSIAMLLPMTALIQPVYVVVKNAGLYNTKAGLILVYTALGIPMTFFILRSYFLSLPVAVEEAAFVDGASFMATFTRIVLPMAKPGLATAGVLQFLNSWNEFLYALVLTSSKGARTLPIALNYFISQFSFNYTAMFAAVVVVVLPSLIIYILLQEQVVGSLTAGSVKG